MGYYIIGLTKEVQKRVVFEANIQSHKYWTGDRQTSQCQIELVTFSTCPFWEGNFHTNQTLECVTIKHSLLLIISKVSEKVGQTSNINSLVSVIARRI